MTYASTALGTNGESGWESMSQEEYDRRWRSMRDEFGEYMVSQLPPDPHRQRMAAAELVDDINAFIRNAQGGTEAENVAGRRRLREYLTHPDTIRARRRVEDTTGRYSAHPYPADLRREVLDAYERAERVARGQSEHDYTPYLLWGGVGLGALLVVGLIGYAAAR